MSRQTSKSHHENNNGSFMDNTNGTTNDSSQSGSSFVGKVRSTLSKWFATPTRTSQQVVRLRSEMEADDSSNDTDEDSEDYNQQATTVVLPPAKRLKTTTETITSASVNNNNTVRLSGLSSFTLRNPKRLVLNRRNNLDIIQTNQDSDDSGESTSGYSSMPRLTQANKQAADHLQHQQEQAEVNDDACPSAQNPTDGNSTMTNLHNRSLFDTSHDRSLFTLDASSYGNRGGVGGRPTSLSARRPAFSGANLTAASNNSTSHCCSSSSSNNNNSGGGVGGLHDRTLATRRIYNSPFYSGRTLYGGASNLTIGQHCFNQSMVEKAAVVIEPKVTTDNSATLLSSTARRILDTLESYTLDQTGAATVARNNSANHRRQLKQDHLFRSAKPYNRVSTNSSNSNNNRRLVDELHVPNIAQLLKMKERLQNQTVQVRQMMKESSVAATITATQPTPSSGKMRAKVTAHVRQHKHHHEQQQQQIADTAATTVEDCLRLSAIQLPITALPTFTDLHIPPLPSVANTATTIKHKLTTVIAAATVAPSLSFVPPPQPTLPPPTTTTTTKQGDNDVDDQQQQMFVFAKPLVLLDSGLNGSTSSRLRNLTAINNFKFSVPLNQKLLHHHHNRKQQQQKTTSATTDIIVDSSCSKQRKQETSTSVPVQQQTTSMSSPFGGNSKVLPSSSSTSGGDTQWECDVCLVRNSSKVFTCLACTSRKPQQKQQPSAAAAISSSVGWAGTPFNKLQSNNRWSCDVCLVSNANERAMCAACETPRTAAAVVTVAPSTTDSGGTWECPSCMVRNQLSNRKCVCCETLQPGVSVSATVVAAGGNDVSLVTKYNFGITPITATSSTSTPLDSAVVAAASGFTFGIPAATVVVVPSSSSTLGVVAPAKPAAFTFGTQTATLTPPTAARSYNGTVSSTTTLLNNQQQQKQTLPNGMISSSNTTAATTTTTTTTTAVQTAVIVVATTATTLPQHIVVDTNALAGIKFGGTAPTTAQPQQHSSTSAPFTFGRSAADVSSSTNSVLTTVTTPAAITTTTTTASSNFGSVSSTAVTAAQAQFQFHQQQQQQTLAKVSSPPTTKATIACAFGGKPAAAATAAVVAAVTSKPPAPAAMFSFGGSHPVPPTSNTAQQQVHGKGAPFMFGGSATVAPPAATPAPLSLFSFGAAPTTTATATAGTGFGFGPPTMTFGGSNSNMFGQPKMKNGGFDFCVAKPVFQAAAAAPSAVGFNFLPSAAVTSLPPPNNRGIFSFGPSSAAGANGAPAAAAATPFTFGAVSSSSQSHTDGGSSSKPQTTAVPPQPPLSFGGITSSSGSSSSGTVLPSVIASLPQQQHSNMFGAIAAADHGVGGQRRIIRKAVRRTNTQPR